MLAVVGHLLLRGAVPLHQSAVSIAARRPITAQYHLHSLRVVHVVVVLAVLLVLVVVLGLVVPPALELQTKVHTKVYNLGEGPDYGLLLTMTFSWTPLGHYAQRALTQ